MFEELRAKIEAALDQFTALPDAPPTLRDAIRYSVLGGGKRLRPLICLLAAQTAGRGDAMAPACAIELLHSYTLIHDDLPSMDDDVLRRGQPTVHVKFGEATAILAGDALQALAFKILPPNSRLHAELADAAFRVVCGQVNDTVVFSGGARASLTTEDIAAIHRDKTCALFRAAARMGGIASAADSATIEALDKFAMEFGAMFQIVDDLLDAPADGATPGELSCLLHFSRAEAISAAREHAAAALMAGGELFKPLIDASLASVE